jgi:hypothetical protein
MKSLVYGLLVLVLVAGCKQKKKERKDTSQYLPVLSLLHDQFNKIDSSLAGFIKIERVGNRSDSLIISREEAKKYAREFLDIPDIRIPKYGSDYVETKLYDSLMGLAIWSYQAQNEDLEVSRQDVTVLPSFSNNDAVKTFYIEKNMEKSGELIEKKMTWEVGHYFQIKTITQKDDSPEKIHDLKIVWQDFELSK